MACTASTISDDHLILGLISRFGFDHPASIALIANIILFVPMGLLVPLILRRPTFLLTMCLSLGIIVTIEVIQDVTNLGSTDIDDVILNMVGCLVGYFVCLISMTLIKKSESATTMG
ncbi:VanZ family protein [Paenibacillus taihuensis]|uniref:VanZ family protein n=1 Tax=Paenibacillus taihuensis TaxID=1156355 RepID=UPI000E2896CF